MRSLETVSVDADAFRRAVKTRTAYRPLFVKIKLVFACNLKCEMCNHWRETREPPLPASRWMEILDELAALGCRKIHFTGGEAMLRRETPDLIAHAASLGIKPTMTTNGTLVTKELAKRLVQAGLRGVNVSIDSPDRKTHDQIRGVRGALKKATRAIEYFHRFKSKGKLTLRINTVVGRSNYATLAPMPDLAHDLGVDALNLIAVDDHCGEHITPRKRDIQDYNQRIAPRIAERALELGLMSDERQAYPFGRTENDVKRARRGLYAFGYYDRHPCFAPWTHTLIDYNGLVYVCCMTRELIEPLGDLKSASFTEIWNGAAYQKIRQMMHPPALAPCRRCDDFVQENKQLLKIASTDVASSQTVISNEQSE